jgi:hypothetical protein
VQGAVGLVLVGVSVEVELPLPTLSSAAGELWVPTTPIFFELAHTSTNQRERCQLEARTQRAHAGNSKSNSYPGRG